MKLRESYVLFMTLIMENISRSKNWRGDWHCSTGNWSNEWIGK